MRTALRSVLVAAAAFVAAAAPSIAKPDEHCAGDVQGVTLLGDEHLHSAYLVYYPDHLIQWHDPSGEIVVGVVLEVYIETNGLVDLQQGGSSAVLAFEAQCQEEIEPGYNPDTLLASVEAWSGRN